MACGDDFTDKHGDRTGVALWGYADDKKMFFVKRKSGHYEYFKYRSKFSSFTSVDLSEVVRAPFYNTSDNIQAWDFKRFLEDQVKKGFSGFPTSKSTIEKIPGLRDGKTGKIFKNVMWPPTDKEKIIPIARPLPDGSLRSMRYWVYDDNSTTTVIRLKST